MGLATTFVSETVDVFSVGVEQNLRKLGREFGAEVAESAFVELFERRTSGESIEISHTLERNFMTPQVDCRTDKDFDSCLPRRSCH